ncbi:MAG: tetratricopeptide repeat protein [Elusimicrobia bacterium]|nr:tetratricopeptide repeat protein [Elusimicrobiota bacterium]
MKLWLLLAAWAVPAFCADAPPADAPAAAAPETHAQPDAKPDAKSDAKSDLPDVAAPKPVTVADEWAFAKAAGQDENADVRKAAIPELELFARRRPDAPQAPDALLLAADLRQKDGDWPRAMGDLLRLIAAYPGSPALLSAKSDFLSLVAKRAPRRDQPALSALPESLEGTDPVERLSQVWRRIADRAPDALYEPVVLGIDDLFARDPGRGDSDELLRALARLDAANGEPASALLSWRKLLALCPASMLRPVAQMSIGDLYAEALHDPRAAIVAYQELAEKFPRSIQVQAALEKSAALFENKLHQYDLAVEQLERVVALFPKTPASLRALQSIARLQRDRLNNPDAAIKTLQRLSKMHGGQDGVKALLLAAEIARRDLKDSGRQAALLHQVADDYPAAQQSPEALYDCAGVWEDAGNTVKAIEVYKEVATKFPNDRYARKASKRVAKLSAAKS